MYETKRKLKKNKKKIQMARGGVTKKYEEKNKILSNVSMGFEQLLKP